MVLHCGAMKRLALGLTALAFFTVAPSACSRNNIEAINLSNEADKAKASNIDEAISKYEQATNLDPTNHRIWWKLAQAYVKKEQWDKVASACVHAQKQAPTYANYYLYQGIALARQAVKGPTNWSEAKAPLQEAIQKDPNLSDAYFELAEVLLRLDDEQGALQNYTKAIEVKSDELSYYGPLADMYLRLGFLDQAEQVAKEGISQKANQKDAAKYVFTLQTLLGGVREMKGDNSGAVGAYEKAKEACGQCNEGGQQIAYFNLGVAYANSSPPKKGEAMNNLQKFQNVICKGAGAQRYQDQCSTAQQFVSRLGGTLQ